MAIGAILLCNLIAKTLCLFQKASAKRVFLPLTSCFPSSPALFTHLGSRNKANCPQDFLQSKQDKDTSAPEIYHHLQGTTTHYPCQQLTEISQQAGQLGFRKQAGYALRHTVQGGWYSLYQTRASRAKFCTVSTLLPTGATREDRTWAVVATPSAMGDAQIQTACH